MAYDAGSISASLTLNISQFVAGINSATNSMRQLGGMLGPQFNNGASSIDNATRSSNNLNSSLKDMTRIVGGILLSQAFYQGMNAIKSATDSVVEFSNSMERAHISMEYFLGSKQAADGYVKTMQDFAAVTAFSTDQVITLSRRLMGAGFDPTQVKSVMEILNDASSATGGTPEQLDRIVLALSQIKTNGKLAGQEVRQLAEAGIPVYQILEKQLGLTAKQMQNLGKLHISGDMAVEAILKGLQDKYKGAGEAIANTMSGIWSNMKDDALIVSSKMFEGPYNAMENLLRGWKDSLDKMRDIVQQNGVGGLLEKMVPPELQESIRLIVGSVISLAHSFETLMHALSPVVGLIVGGFTQAFGSVMPIIAMTVRLITSIVAAALNASPALQLLVAAIGALVIAQTASKALMLLWTVTRMGAICSVVAAAVNTLTNALKALMVAMIEDPITAIIILIAGGLLYLAMSSDKATASLQGLMTKLGQLMGVNMDSVLKPTQTADMSKWADEFNKSVVGSNTNLQNTGKQLDNAGNAAKKAGKKVKDTFVASFDELYQVPDKLDKTATALDSLGSGFDPSKLTIPNIPNLPTTNTDTNDSGRGQLPSQPQLPLLPSIINLPTIKFPPIDPPDPPNMAPVTNAIATVQSLIDDLVKKLKMAGDSVTSWVNETTQELQTWSASTKGFVSDWVTTTEGQIVGWVATTGVQLGTWTLGQILNFANWATTVESTISGWVVNTEGQFSGWVLHTEGMLNSWSTNVIGSFTVWVSNTSSAIVTWVATTAESFALWVSNTQGNLATWSSNVQASVKAFTTNAKVNINTWATGASASIAKWATNTANNIATWSNGAVSATSVFALNAGKNIANWVSGTSSGIADWTTNVLHNFKAFADGGAGAVESFAKNAWNAFNAWVSGTADGIYGWANSVMGTLNSWAQSAWSTIVKLAKAAGQTVSGSFDGLGASLVRASASIGSWVSNNSNWLIPVGIGAGIVGATIATVATGGAAAPSFALLGLETGGIVDKEQIIRVGEKDHREAVIPLENSSYMKPFSAAVANDLMSMMGGKGSTGSTQDTRPNFYVGTLIADERSLKELYRKINIIQQKENMRGGLV